VSAGFPIYTIEQIEPLLNRRGVIEAVRDALIRHARGEVRSPMPGHLLFEEARGDCHIKFGHMAGAPNFAVKIATGFYDNASLGLPSANGVILLLDARTGAPLCLFQDGGWMTAWRTAAATAIAAHWLSPEENPLIGIIGTGLQAQLTPAWLLELLPEARFIMTGRDMTRTSQIAATSGATPVATTQELLAMADIVITATPSAVALFDSSHVRQGTHFVALGADGPEKQELPADLFARATHIVCDDVPQCTKLSDFGRAVRAGVITADDAIPLGRLLSGDQVITHSPDEISIVSLTGLAAQDIAIAEWFARQMPPEDGKMG